MATIDDIRERLSEIRPPGTAHDILAAKMVQRLELRDGTVSLLLMPGSLPTPALEATIADIRRAVGALPGVGRVDVHLTDPGEDAEEQQTPIPGVQDIIAVSSAKGGVGKSTVALNLALALRAQGASVGVLDADVYGPSLPLMAGISQRPAVSPQQRVTPVEKYGLQLMSLGFFLDDTSPVMWRGPLVMGLIRQFLQDVEWRDLDVLVIDLPPGTGDAPLTLVQLVPIAGGVIVTTPQDVALRDVERGIAMFQRVNAPVLGVIENMSFYECPKCGRREDVFGTGGGERISRSFGVPLLGQIPLVPLVREGGDAGEPILITCPEHPVSRAFMDIAARVEGAIESAREAAPVIIA